MSESSKVDFIICGAQKGGTTALFRYLRSHPEIKLSFRKEVHFFDNELFFKDDLVDYQLYHDHFESFHEDKVRGEATPIYMYWEPSARRIWEYNSQAKLIFLLRNPIDRAYSHWNMERSKNKESLSFSDAIRCEKDRCKSKLPLQHRVFSYIDRGFYSEQIRRFCRFFPMENLLFVLSEDLKSDPSSVLSEICDFIGVSSGFYSQVEPRLEHSIQYLQPMSEGDRLFLENIFLSEVVFLESFLGRKLSHWLTQKS
ncbi:sulfotransferase domain-containing protein [Amphritea sp.]|uniref:sulfotransferase domain-containing protein n=1 Tax=Amphritea sp. TaxID=1872502 RepID=UPI003D0987B8